MALGLSSNPSAPTAPTNNLASTKDRAGHLWSARLLSYQFLASWLAQKAPGTPRRNQI
jgi:hypothetical protein